MTWALALAGCEREPVPGPGAEETDFVDERAALAVAVRDDAGAPLPGVWVLLDPTGRETATDESGVATFEALGAGTFTVTATAEGYGAATGTATLAEADASLELALAAEQGVTTTLAGEVLDLAGAPVVGASVWLEGALVATTGEDGVFEARGLDAGTWVVEVTPPEGSGLLSWEATELVLAEAGRAEIAVSLGPTWPAEATYRGSDRCLLCHDDLEDSYGESAHFKSGHTPEEAEDEDALAGLWGSFLAGDTVEIEDLGATVTLAGTAGGDWTATITDAWGDSTGALPVVHVYGGQRTGAALSVESGGTEALLPLAWALAGQGLSSEQDEAGWVAAWTEGWFDASGRLALDGSERPDEAASFALQCAGCHATGGKLEQSGGAYAIVEGALSSELERRVGCEACHGPGSAHAAASSDHASLIMNPANLPPHQKVELCARCHERATPTDHPFSDAPGWAVRADGEQLGPLDALYDYATGAPVRWTGLSASRAGWDQAGDLRVSPHMAGEAGYAGGCVECHDPHGSEHASDLTADIADNSLCTSCHASLFPDEAAEAEHTRHGSFAPGEWSPGSCVGCHFPRLGHSVRPDAVSGAGELRAHVLDFIPPEAALAEFDAAGLDLLPYGDAPVGACLDCHLQADAAEEDEGSDCACPVGDPRKRSTYEHFQWVYETVWGLE